MAWNTGRKFSEEHKKKLSKAHLGKKHSEETRAKMSKSRLGKVTWSKGLTKENDASVAKIAKAHVGVPLSEEHKKKISKAQSKAHKNRVTNYWGYENALHKLMKLKIKDLLQALGHKVSVEKFVTVNGHRYAVDIYSKKDNEVFIFEIGRCRASKLVDLMSRYSNVYQIPKLEETV